MTETTKYYRVSEVAKEFGVSSGAVRNWIEKGYLPGSRKKGPAINSPIIIPGDAIDKLRAKLDEETY